MAYPTIVSVREFKGNSDDIPKLVPMPGVINTGDLLIMIFNVAGFGNSISTPTNWTSLGGSTNGVGTAAAFAKRADGTEDGTTVSVTHGNFAGVTRAVAQTYRITGWPENDPLTLDVKSAVNEDNGIAITFDGLTPGWGPGVETLWLTMLAINGNENVVSPSSGFTIYRTTAVGSFMTVSTAYYSSTDETMSPGDWTLDNSGNCIVFTIGIRAASSAPPGDLVVYADSPSFVVFHEVSIY